MFNILIKTDSHYKINRDRVRKFIEKVLTEKGMKGNIEVSVAVVGDRQMKLLNSKYRKLNAPCSILAFPQTDGDYDKGPFVDPPDNILRLGDIVISYPQIVGLSAEENILVDDKIDELIKHGLSTLLGQIED